jgi:hypothetical protein
VSWSIFFVSLLITVSALKRLSSLIGAKKCCQTD